ncbi:MAG: hypothetical protein A2087_12935 [Spirochaetes bacterium GWD1_61_31]|nr:MAG: hypothetical protein A2Y37_05600 [Spirochaetes bacterium GWB1_60_80]OHD34392.1 MAG: hypothetical protein A2004_06955 [Spirochaetes bacterium GWC1_61_12]OHD35620.1 MAG: hypothetical protein A2087_12935 [Spirochaetes bacterium GWD1_61_31]OHD41658.1 MAG: hypothetical protein A2Y35_08950 [Spirochaetes bacterium GWE1_60_18]OHD61681.1 MAG: hypothetical protein A2Y32_03060 [Spirochaetes bacterium GWF1_60_12]HAP42900.1 hypothetical protein [Spirochaetaceae bacterium]
MTIETSWLVYPDGDRQETTNSLRVNQLVDMNGFSLSLPLRDPHLIAYRVFKLRRLETRGELNIMYYLELVPVNELSGGW